MSNIKQLEATVTQYEQLAAQLKTAIDAVVAAVPAIELGPSETKRFVAVHKAVPPDFVVALVNSAENGSGVFDADEAKAVLQLRNSFGAIVAEAVQLATVLQFTIDAHYARVVKDALTEYAVTRRNARSGDPAMALKAQTLKRVLGAGVKRKPKSQQPQSPQPQTPAPSPADPKIQS
jgi:hypothetical protein